MIGISILAVATATFIVQATWPLAMVAETFDYDVLRALNNPLILHEAQRVFGQQVLSHLVALDWGLRFCGTTITTRFVVNIVLGLVIAMTTSLSQAVMSKYSTSA